MGALGALSLAAQSQTSADTLPPVGARVRVLAPRLGEGWHIGMFNRLRVEPPCYRVLLFSPTGSRRITATLSVHDLRGIQVSTLYDGQTRPYKFDPDAELDSKESWREVSMEVLAEAERNCRVGDERSSGRSDNGTSQPNNALQPTVSHSLRCGKTAGQLGR
jgi:hypothetical protein